MRRYVFRVVTADFQSSLHNVARDPAQIVALTIGGWFIGLPVVIGSIASGIALGARVPDSNQAVLAIVLALLGLALLVFGAAPVIGTFFIDRRLLFLLTTPMSAVEVFAARLVTSFWLSGLVSVPLVLFCLGIGFGRRAGLAYAAAAAVIGFGWTTTIVALEVALLSLLLRFVPAKQVRSAAILVAVIGAGLLGAFQFLLSSFRPGKLGDFLVLAGRVSWLPSAWPARALEAFARGDLLTGLSTGAVTVGAFSAVVVAAGLLYRSSVLIGVGALAGGGASARHRTRMSTRLASRPAKPLRAMVRKDWRVLRRDVRRLVQVAPVLVFGIFYFPLLQSVPAVISFAGLGWFWLLALGWPVWMLSTSFGALAVPQEGRSFQLLRLSPRGPTWILGAKLCFALPPVVAVGVGVAMLTLALHRASMLAIAAAVALSCWWAAGFTVIAVAGGAIWPNLGRGGVTLSGLLMVTLGDMAFSGLSLAGLAISASALSQGLAFTTGLGLLLLGAAAGLPIFFVGAAVDRLIGLEPSETG